MFFNFVKMLKHTYKQTDKKKKTRNLHTNIHIYSMLLKQTKNKTTFNVKFYFSLYVYQKMLERTVVYTKCI